MTNFEFLERHNGLTQYAWRQLRSICRELNAWDVMRCNGEIQYDDDSGKVYRYASSRYGDFTERPVVVPDRAAQLLERASTQAARFGLKVYHQEDPRGCSLYVYTQQALNDALERREKLRQPGMRISACYNSIGTPIC